MDREIPDYNRNPRFIKLKKTCSCKENCKCQAEQKREYDNG